MGCVPSSKDRLQGERTSPQLVEQLAKGSLIAKHPSSAPAANQLLKELMDRTGKSIVAISLLFRASENHFQAVEFHKACKQCGNTLLIAQAQNKCMFGGFTPALWKEDAKYTYEEDKELQSFLWASKRPNHQELEKELEIFPLKKEGAAQAIQSDVEAGPIFGAGHDLYIRDQANKEQSTSSLGSSYYSPHPYGSLKSNSLLTKMDKFTLMEYEIWQVTLS